MPPNVLFSVNGILKFPRYCRPQALLSTQERRLGTLQWIQERQLWEEWKKVRRKLWNSSKTSPTYGDAGGGEERGSVTLALVLVLNSDMLLTC